MDKYELSIKEDKIRKHAEKKDYAAAAKIADTIDWKKVKNIKMLTLVSQIYEKVRNYTEAKNVLLIAYERVPVGRRMLYKLTELCVKAGNLDEAEEFFEEFQGIAPNDISKLILAYQIEAARGEPLEKLIMILELYRKNEFEEKWAYELAYLYHKAGKVKECVQLCNEIILWFSVGPYVDKALDLKMQYEPLTPSQQEKLVNKKKFEERIKAVEREFEAKYSQELLDSRGDTSEPVQEEARIEEAAMTEEPEITEEVSIEETPSNVLLQDTQLQDMEADLAQAVREAAEGINFVEEADGQETKEILTQTQEVETPEIKAPESEAPERDLNQTAEFLNEVSAALAVSAFVEEEQENKAESDRKANKQEETADLPEESEEKAAEEQKNQEGQKISEEPEKMAGQPEKSQLPGEGSEGEPSEELKDEDKASEDLIKEVSAAMAASISSVMPEETGKEIEKEIIEQKIETGENEPVREAPAGAVPETVQTEEEEPEEEIVSEHQITCVVVDEEPGAERISVAVEKLKRTHEILGVPTTQVAKVSGEKLSVKGIYNTFTRLSGRDLIVDYAADLSEGAVADLVKELQKPSMSMVVVLLDSSERMDNLLMKNPALDKLCVYLEDDSQMSVDDFVACATAYAKEEECIIDEMGGLALYAAVERMRNDGVQLTEHGARDLIDEAIEKAEHRGLKGLFGSKYDKNGYLILKEQYFKNI